MSITNLQFLNYVGGVLADATSVTLADPTGTTGLTRDDRAAAAITDASTAAPCVVTTAAAHGFMAGEGARISGVVGRVELNGQDVYVNPLTATTLALYQDAALTTPVNSSAYTAYVSGGTLTPWVVKAGTAFAHFNTGDYRYSLTDPGDNLEYTFFVQVVQGGVTRHVVYHQAGGVADGILLSEARNIVEQSVLWAAPGTYTAARLDRAIIAAGEKYIQEAKPATQTDVLTTVGNQITVDLTTLAGFLPSALVDVYVTVDGMEYRLETVDVDWMRGARERGGAAGRPEQICFSDQNTAWLYPTPGDAYPLTVVWHPPFTPFTPGTSVDRTLNIPARLVHQVLWFGAAALLVAGEAGGRKLFENLFPQYLDWIKKTKTAGLAGANTATRKRFEAYL